MHVILILLLGHGINLHSWIRMANALPTDKICRNKLITYSDGMYDVKSDIYDLSPVWESCRVAIGAREGKRRDPDMSKMCESVHYNLGILCNMTISEENSINVEKVWKNKYNGTDICQGNYNFYILR